MKNSKKYEKNVDQSTRSRSIVSRWAVRLLVLLVMITTILASFVVPASAADPFRGSGVFDFNYLSYVSQHSSVQQSNDVYNPLPSEYVFNLSQAFYISDRKFIFEAKGNFPEFNIVFTDQRTMVENNYSDFPFLSCSLDVVVYDNNHNQITVPAGEIITEYIYNEDLVFAPSSGIKRICRPSTYAGSSGPHRFEFTLNPDGVSYQFEGGIRSVFDVIATWIGNTFSQLSSIFFADGSLTFVGIFCVASVAFGVILLLFSIISRFLRFGG